jgi:hypothetical protein
MYQESAHTITQSGANITTGASSAAATIPNNSAAAVANRVRVSATAAAYVKFGATAAAGDLLVQPGDSMILNVPKGATQLAAIQVTTAGIVNIAPIEA